MRYGSFAGAMRSVLLLLGLTLSLIGCDGSSAFLSPEVAMQRAAAAARPDSTQLEIIAIGPPDATIVAGTSIKLTATGISRNGSRQDITARVTWTSSNPTVASFASASGMEGVATAGSIGTTTIKASLEGVSTTTSLTVTPATLTSITVTPTSATLARGTNQQFAATAEYSDHTTRDVTSLVTWLSTDPRVMSVSNPPEPAGQARALQAGSAGITALLGQFAGTSNVIVTRASLTAIEVTPSAASVTQGQSIQFTATGLFADKTTQDLTTLVTWTTNNSSVAAIANSTGRHGIATATNAGTTLVTASFDGLTATASLQVTGATLTSLSITPTTPTLARGLTRHFTVTGTYSNQSTADLTASAVWTSSDGAVLSISNALNFEGLANAIGAGQATITATVGTLSSSTVATVTNATLVSIGVTPATTSTAKGLTRQFTATGVYTDLSTQDLTGAVTWGSSDPAVATLSNAPGSRGLLSAANAGVTTVSATVGGVTGQTLATVTTATLVSIAITPNAGPLNLGYSRQLTATGTYTDSSTQDLTSAATWSSSNTSAASISNGAGTKGLAGSVAVGTTLIRASYSGVTSPDLSLVVSSPVVVSIVVTPATPSMAKGTTLQLTGSFLYSDNSTTDETSQLTWSTSDSGVATVRNTAPVGRVTAVTPGTVTITASKTGVTAGSVTLTVTAASLVSIAVTPGSSTIANGTQKAFTATGTYTDSSTQNLTATATWASSDTAIATISNSPGSQGLATSAGVGSTFISATVGSVTSPNATLLVNSGTAYAYVVNQFADTVSMFRVDSGATIVSLGTVATGDAPISMSIDPLNRYAYVANQDDSSISLYTIGANGLLTPHGTMSTGPTPLYCVVDSSGRYFYTANYADNTLSQFRINADGTLTANGTVMTGSSPYSLAADPLGRHIYVADFFDTTLSQFTIGPNGTLTLTDAVAADNLPNAIAIDPTGQFVYVTNQSGTVSQFSVSANGTLASLGTATAGDGPTSLAVDPTSHYLYVANYTEGTISQFTIGSGGTLSLLNTTGTVPNPYSIDVDPSGRYVYTANSTDSTVTRYTISVDGSLVLQGSDPTGSYPMSVVTTN